MQKFKISTALGCSRFWRFGGDRSAVGSLQVNDKEFILPGKMATALTQRARDDLGGGGSSVGNSLLENMAFRKRIRKPRVLRLNC